MPISTIVTNSIANANVTLAKLANDAITPKVVKPTNVTPANAAINVAPTATLTGSEYLNLYGIAKKSAIWQISTSSDFSSPIYNANSVGTGVSNTITSGVLSATTKYFWRVRYEDVSNNVSEFSDPTEFTTAASMNVDFLVVAGGGSGAANGGVGGGGGGAGGVRTSVGNSGGPSPANSPVAVFLGSDYPVTVGSGGTGGEVTATNGNPSVFASITSIGGGRGHGYQFPGQPAPVGPAGSGGSGGGAGPSDNPNSGGTGTPGQGNPGGTNAPDVAAGVGGGGAGAGTTTGPDGGAGISNSITGSPVTRGGGGGAGRNTWQFGGSAGTGGPGGGGPGGNRTDAGSENPGTAGSVNTGGGGGGGGRNTSGSGGSGIVILRYPNARTISNPGGGLTLSSSPSGGNTVSTITAGTGNVSWS
jgi:hypothetical protein